MYFYFNIYINISCIIIFYRKNPLSFLGISIGKFVKITVKSSIHNYFSKGVVKDEKDLNIQSGIPKNGTINSEINDTSQNDTYTDDQESSTKNSTLNSTEQQLPSLENSNNEQNDTSTGNMKNIKTMFAQMRNTSSSSTNNIAFAENVDKEIEKGKKNNNQLNMNSFFSKKLEIISPTKRHLNDQVTGEDLPASTSSISFFSKKLEVISPSKNIQNNSKVALSNQSSNGFFSKKLEIVSPSKYQNTKHDSQLINQSPIVEESTDSAPTMLLCERCNNMIHIDEYEEHIDHHVAIELSKSLNEPDVIGSISNKHKKSVTSESGKKRKNNSKSFSKQKKPCSDISLFFKPVLNP